MCELSGPTMSALALHFNADFLDNPGGLRTKTTFVCDIRHFCLPSSEGFFGVKILKVFWSGIITQQIRSHDRYVSVTSNQMAGQIELLIIHLCESSSLEQC